MSDTGFFHSFVQAGGSAEKACRIIASIAVLFLYFLFQHSAVCQNTNDEGYTKQIRANTTEPFFRTNLTDHLPKSATVPTPQQYLGYIVGAPDHLTYSKDIYGYYRALAKASPRVKVFSAGRTEEGREFLLVAVSDEANIAQLDRYREITAKLADPRKISEAQALELEKEGKPFYWASGSIHSPETGSPEMLMELAYRLAVEDTPFIKNIRKNSIFLITPIVEVDGHDRMVDLFHYHYAYPSKVPPPLVYWGHYVAHDNNRDGIGMGLELTQMMMREFSYFHPQVLHDLHESVPYLYISTGTGPYNAWLDPITVSEWEKLASNELEKFSEHGVVGVWTHGYYDGWAPNYMFFIANDHNSVGRFYETFGNMYPDTRLRTAEGDRPFRTWFRQNPPLPTVLWSLRDNVNLQESGLLFALDYAASHREEMLSEFYLKSKRAVAKATTEGPAAWAIENQTRPALAAQLVRLLEKQAVEVSRLSSSYAVNKLPASVSPIESSPASNEKSGTPTGPGSNRSGHPENNVSSPEILPAGTYIVRMDQPYSRIADMLLDQQYYSIHDPEPYDDTGWSLGPLFNVRTVRITDAGILRAPMTAIQSPLPKSGADRTSPNDSNVKERTGRFYLLNANAEPGLASLRFSLPDVKFFSAEKAFSYQGRAFNAGSFIIPSEGNPSNLGSKLAQAAHNYDLRLYSGDEAPQVARHPIHLPRIALVHTWTDTQNEGWFRLAFDQSKIGYTYISTTVVRNTPDLRAKYDVVLLPPVFGGAAAILNGIPTHSQLGSSDYDAPIPWEKSSLTPNFGLVDHAADIRGGLGFEGLAHLKSFVKAGGLLIAVGSSAELPTEFGLTPGVRILPTPNLHAQGGVFLTHVEDPLDPVTYGYDTDVPVYFDQSPVFQVSVPNDDYSGGYFSHENVPPRTSGRGSLTDPDIPQGRPYIKMNLEQHPLTRKERETYIDPEDLLYSGGLIAPKSLWAHVILRFADKDLLISGLLSGEKELAGAPAIVETSQGQGHILLFANNPMWRQETEGSFMLLFNAILNFDALNASRTADSSTAN